MTTDTQLSNNEPATRSAPDPVQALGRLTAARKEETAALRAASTAQERGQKLIQAATTKAKALVVQSEQAVVSARERIDAAVRDVRAAGFPESLLKELGLVTGPSAKGSAHKLQPRSGGPNGGGDAAPDGTASPSIQGDGDA